MTKSTTIQSATAVDDEAVSSRRRSFLSLPAEIRNKIYQYSLVERPSRAALRIKGLAQPPLTRTNRQVRSEALPIYYGNNRFEIIIPDKQPMNKYDGWADFIRMFRVFKAGRSAGPGTGSLQYLRNITCLQSCGSTGQSFWELEAMFLVPNKPGHRKYYLGCADWDSHLGLKPRKEHVLDNRKTVHACVAKALRDKQSEVMHETCVQRLISTVVMIATECPGVVKEVHFHANWRFDDEHEEGLGFDWRIA
ncbi:hypothetical protein DHEL01_v203264 [Diaporthe helianthi]|uniref:F-box domain-containing protein n=1 Tax=Diaporthe helianthi TaxID=158607 RepID=A0A2P5I775_DIAHE|nr:hypothetical protein DHEL01_v203264 [Diaporthe helianthi]